MTQNSPTEGFSGNDAFKGFVELAVYVCVRVSLLVATVSPAKSDVPIDM